VRKKRSIFSLLAKKPVTQPEIDWSKKARRSTDGAPLIDGQNAADLGDGLWA